MINKSELTSTQRTRSPKTIVEKGLSINPIIGLYLSRIIKTSITTASTKDAFVKTNLTHLKTFDPLAIQITSFFNIDYITYLASVLVGRVYDLSVIPKHSGASTVEIVCSATTLVIHDLGKLREGSTGGIAVASAVNENEKIVTVVNVSDSGARVLVLDPVV